MNDFVLLNFLGLFCDQQSLFLVLFCTGEVTFACFICLLVCCFAVALQSNTSLRLTAYVTKDNLALPVFPPPASAAGRSM